MGTGSKAMDTKPKRLYEDIYKRNQAEKERVLRQLESEGITEKKVGEVLEEFSQNGFPLTVEGVLRMVAPLKARYGLPKIGSSIYPDPPSPMPLDWKKGMRWTLEFPSGQSISVVISNDGKYILERTYSDRGNISIRDVYQFLKSWQKGTYQVQHGGRKPDQELMELFRQWQATSFNPKEKAVFRKKYTDAHPDDPFAPSSFNQAMRRYKSKVRGTKSRKRD